MFVDRNTVETEVRGKTRATARNGAWRRTDSGHGEGQGQRLVRTRARTGARDAG